MLRTILKSLKPSSSLLLKNNNIIRSFAVVSNTNNSTSTSKRLSLSLKKEYEQEAEVMTSDYYESENNIIKEFLKKNNDWKIIEKSMQSSVEMKKNHGNEEYINYIFLLYYFRITVIFDREREDFDAQMSQQNEQQEEGQEEEPAPMMMLPFTVIIGKGEKGALGFEMVFRHTGLSINNVIHYADTKVAIEDSATADHARKNNYEGPDVAAYVF